MAGDRPSITPDEPPPVVAELVRRFDDHIDAYKSGRYNETQLRREFIDPLFRGLGWDVDNEQGYAEAYKGNDAMSWIHRQCSACVAREQSDVV